jgi:hypothetical protein
MIRTSSHHANFSNFSTVAGWRSVGGILIARARMKILAFLLFLAIFPCGAQTPVKYSSTVQLLITCDDDSMKNQFSSFVGRELRALGDITIVDAKPDIVITSVIVKHTGVTQAINGFSVATLITSPESTGSLDLIKDKLEPWILLFLKNEMAEGSNILKFDLRIGSLRDLKSISEELVADFDAKILNPRRKFWGLYKRSIEGINNSAVQLQ